VLAVGADEEELVALSPPMELLCQQAALTLHRIALGQEIARRDSEAYFRALVQNTSDAILIVDPAHRVRYASPSALAMFEHDVLLGRNLPDLIGPVYAADVAAWGAEPPTRESIRRDWELPMASGLVHEVEATVADLRAEPTVGGFVVSLHDVTTARGLERTLQRHAYHDPLTGLPNRLAFSRGLDDALELASPEVTVSVVMLDLDHFREVNDFHGREAGDEVLRATTRMLRSVLQPGDVLARVGGDEFAVLQVRSAADTPALPLGMPGEQGPYFVGSINVTTSGALATGTPKSTGASLLGDVEMTLHAAKAAGVNSWRRYDPELRAELALAAARRSGLDQALREESFQLVYQPLVWLDDGDVAGFESLVRWPQPDGGVVMPDEFIPLAEATGQILPLGRWILRTATEQAAEWNRRRAARGAPPVKVSVNVSAYELRDPLFPTIVAEALKNADLDPQFLILEATESALIHHAGTALANLRVLVRGGIGIALDDFGTGYSSLSYLRDLPVSGLKIDKAFVDGVPEVRRQTALVRGIIGIAKSLDLLVIAEGIENPVQRDMLLAMGADIGQGYLFSRPMSVGEAAELMAAGVVDLLEDGIGGAPAGYAAPAALHTPGSVPGIAAGPAGSRRGQEPGHEPDRGPDRAPRQGTGSGSGPADRGPDPPEPRDA
jgi:PAS domain S-box-containing protein